MFAKDFFSYMMNGRVSNPFLNYTNLQMYICDCGEGLDNKAQNSFNTLLTQEKFENFIEHAWIYHTKGWLCNANKIIIEFDFNCSCGKKHNAKYYTHMFLYGDKPKYEHYLLAHISGTDLRCHNGVFSKTDCLTLWEKLSIRWNLLADQIYAISPYIGHNFLAYEKKIDLWNKIFLFLPCERTIFVSKTSTLNKFKKEFVNYDELKKYGKISPILLNAINREASHAKFYAGNIDGNVEILSGSHNFTSGPSLENLSFTTLIKEDFLLKFIQPYKISKNQHMQDKKQHYYYTSFGSRKFSDGYTIFKEELLSRFFS